MHQTSMHKAGGIGVFYGNYNHSLFFNLSAMILPTDRGPQRCWTQVRR